MMTLWDYRRQVQDLYRMLRTHGTDGRTQCVEFRTRKDELVRSHVQSPFAVDQRECFIGLEYYEYDPAYNIWVEAIEPAKPASYQMDLGDDGLCVLTHFADVEIILPSGSGTLAVYWIEGYGGGVFLPFRDATSGVETYGGGRYILDTIKGADLGMVDNRLRLDFNYAYHPSCTYNPRWICPLAPPQNMLSFSVRVGERLGATPDR